MYESSKDPQVPFRMFQSVTGKLRAANGSFQSAMREIDEWRNAANVGKETLQRVHECVDEVTTKAQTKIVELKKRAISCCFCGCENESLEALKKHSAFCPEHPAVQRVHALEEAYKDSNEERVYRQAYENGRANERARWIRACGVVDPPAGT